MSEIHGASLLDDMNICGFPYYPHADFYPPNKAGAIWQFDVQPENRGPEMSQTAAGPFLFRFVQTYWFSNGRAAQIWEHAGELYAAAVGDQNEFVHCGDIFTFPASWRDVFGETDEEAEEREASGARWKRRWPTTES